MKVFFNTKKKKYKYVLPITISVMLVLGVSSSLFLDFGKANAWECKNRNVVNCGVTDRQDLANKINSGDGVHTDIKSIYANMGIYADDILSVDAVGGVVKKDGSVWVGSTQVASGTSIGYRPVAGLTGTPYAGLIWNYSQFEFDPGVEQAGAYVYMRDGRFLYAILVSCGNPVLQSLNAIPPGITIDKTVRNVTVDPSSAFVESVKAKPGDKVEFNVKITNNSDVTAEDVNIGDYLPKGLTLASGSAEALVKEYQSGAWQDVTIPYTDPEVALGKNVGNFEPGEVGTFLVSATVPEGTYSGCVNLVNTGYADSNQTDPITDDATVVVCVTTPPTPTPTPTPTPVTPTTVSAAQPTTLPASGPLGAMAGVFGTGALGYSGYLWGKSRKNLKDALKKEK